jgi:hypothetical protein
MHLLTSSDVQHVRDLLKPPRHRHAEALPLLRTLVLSEQVALDATADLTHPTNGSWSGWRRSSRRLRTGHRCSPASRDSA